MRSRIIAAVAASTLLFAACGSDDSSSDTTVAVDTTMAAEPGTIVEVASANEDFSTLVAAVTAAGLGETLSGEGPFTVFAPTNEAFAALPAGLLDKLLLAENKDVLVKILTYHVLGAKVMAADVAAGDAATVEGSTIAITTEGGVKVNDATVTATDVPASNGVIHVIDKVIVPPTVDLASL
ncbi:MAG: fasciclin domain-containing protein [Actinomycetota bacterium]